MKKIISSLLLIGSVSMMGAGAASASQEFDAVLCYYNFNLLDADSNGVLTQSEVATIPLLSDLLGTLDSNADGVLDLQEFFQFCALPESLIFDQ